MNCSKSFTNDLAKKLKKKKERETSLNSIQQSFGIPPLLMLPWLKDFLAIIVIRPFKLLHTFSNSFTFFSILCISSLSRSFSSSSGAAAGEQGVVSMVVVIVVVVVVVVDPMCSLDRWEANACTAIPGGILLFLARSLQDSSVSFS